MFDNSLIAPVLMFFGTVIGAYFGYRRLLVKTTVQRENDIATISANVLEQVGRREAELRDYLTEQLRICEDTRRVDRKQFQTEVDEVNAKYRLLDRQYTDLHAELNQLRRQLPVQDSAN